MHLQLTFLWTCRCFSTCLACIIASTSCLFLDLRILPSQISHLHPTFSMPCRYSPQKFLHPQPALSMTCRYSSQKFCILDLLFPWLADTPRRNFASSTCSFHDLQIPPAEILHPQFPHIHYRRYPLSSLASRTEPIDDLQKIDIRNSSEHEMGAGDT